MKALWRESRGLIPWLGLVAFVLAVALLFEVGLLSPARLSRNKDFIDAGATIVTTALLIIGAVFSYLKFFKGRTLSPKLAISARSGALAEADGLRHWIEVSVENKGSVGIWNYNVTIDATLHAAKSRTVTVTEFVEYPKETEGREKAIDIGETVYEHAFLSVPAYVHAVTFQIVVKDQSNTIWWRSLTVKNAESKDATT